MNSTRETCFNLSRAKRWKLRTCELPAGRLPLLMGIVNITPDSFSDGGRFFDPDAAIEHGLQLAAEGADILDIGGESTRPYSDGVGVQEELRRVMPVVGALCRQTKIPISIDTSKSLVARYALDAGAEIINDITAFTGDPAMLPLAVETGCGVCAMHMRGTPRTMQDSPTYDDVVAEVAQYLQTRRDALLAAGIEQDRIALDPGIGFSKTTEHNLQLLANAWRLHALGCPVLIGHSRKRFLADLPDPVASPSPQPGSPQPGSPQPGSPQSGSPQSGSNVKKQTDHSCEETPLQQNQPETGKILPIHHPAPSDRASGTIGVALSMASQGVQVLRVHDVAATRQALLAFAATGGLNTYLDS